MAFLGKLAPLVANEMLFSLPALNHDSCPEGNESEVDDYPLSSKNHGCLIKPDYATEDSRHKHPDREKLKETLLNCFFLTEIVLVRDDIAQA